MRIRRIPVAVRNRRFDGELQAFHPMIHSTSMAITATIILCRLTSVCMRWHPVFSVTGSNTTFISRGSSFIKLREYWDDELIPIATVRTKISFHLLP